MEDKYASLKLENQLCFPLYVASKEVIRQYRPFLDEIDLTYTQYIAMMILWEEEEISVSALGKRLYLDSGTLSPLIRKLRDKEYITLRRSENDERVQLIHLTEKGSALKDKALSVPQSMAECISLSNEDAEILYKTLYRLINTISESDGKENE